MDRALIHCNCGTNYITEIMHMSLTVDPPIHRQKGSAPCYNCNKVYQKDSVATITDEVRHIFPTESEFIGGL